MKSIVSPAVYIRCISPNRQRIYSCFLSLQITGESQGDLMFRVLFMSNKQYLSSKAWCEGGLQLHCPQFQGSNLAKIPPYTSKTNRKREIKHHVAGVCFLASPCFPKAQCSPDLPSGQAGRWATCYDPKAQKELTSRVIVRMKRPHPYYVCVGVRSQFFTRSTEEHAGGQGEGQRIRNKQLPVCPWV